MSETLSQVQNRADGGDGCCHKTRIKGCSCPIGWQCPYSSNISSPLPAAPSDYNLHFGDTTLSVERKFCDLVTTKLPDERLWVFGAPHNTDSYLATAMKNGYGDDVARMNRCHEIGHSLVAHWLGLPASPLMIRLSAGVDESNELTGLEETAVQAIEHFANALGLDLEAIARKHSANSQRLNMLVSEEAICHD